MRSPRVKMMMPFHLSYLPSLPRNQQCSTPPTPSLVGTRFNLCLVPSHHHFVFQIARLVLLANLCPHLQNLLEGRANSHGNNTNIHHLLKPNKTYQVPVGVEAVTAAEPAAATALEGVEDEVHLAPGPATRTAQNPRKSAELLHLAQSKSALQTVLFDDALFLF